MKKSGGDEVRPQAAKSWQMPGKSSGGKGRPISPTHLCKDGDHCSGGQKGAHGGGKSMDGDAC